MMINETRMFLNENRDEIIDFVGSQQRTILTSDDVLHKTVNRLIELIPLTTKFDKTHYELALAILETFWCGWLSQAKANRNAYPKEYPEQFKQILIDSFELGREYAKVKK